jgi:hypothetical protein
MPTLRAHTAVEGFPGSLHYTARQVCQLRLCAVGKATRQLPSAAPRDGVDGAALGAE